jgi:PAS domain S-box-containing protein
VEGEASNRPPTGGANRSLTVCRRVAGVAPVAIGLAGLLGWWLDVDRLTRVADGWPTMNPLTAALCVLLGVALLLRAWPRWAWARRAAQAAAVTGGVVALLALAELTVGFQAHIDRLLSGRDVGRPHASTASSFLLLSVAIVTLDHVTRRGRSLSQILALVAGAIAGVAFIGYAFGVWQLFSPGAHDVVQGMAFHTALAIVLLAAGVLVAHPDVGFVSALVSRHAGGLTSRRLLLGLVAFAPIAVLVVAGRRLGWYGDHLVPALLVFLALVEGALLIQATAVRLNTYDRRQKATEEMLRRSQQRLAQLVGQAPDGIFTADLAGRYLDVNAAGCRLLSLPREQIVGRNIADFVDPEQWDRLSTERALLLQGGTSMSEWSLRRGDGRPIDVEVSATILPDGRWQGFMRDISERKRAQAELAKLYAGEAQQRAWLTNLVEQMPEGVYIIDPRGRTVLMNRVALALSSHDPDLRDAFGNPGIFDLRLPDGGTIPRAERPSVRALEQGEPTQSRELALRQDDGTLVPLLVSAAPIRDDAGTITGVIIVLQDVTPLKQLERMREEWTSVVAHDLKQPVNAISVSADMLSRLSPPDTPDRTRRAIARIQSGVKRLTRMIADLSDASQIEADRLTVVQASVDLGPLVASVAEGLRDSTNGRPIVVDAPPGRWAWIDADRIQQVLTNLLVNAVKYGEAGTDIRVKVLEHGDALEVVVTNRGPGISAEDLPRLFSRFGRTGVARASATPGSGLGLYIAKGLVDAHGGHIWVDSTPGETTSFHFVVPRAEPPAQVTGEAPAPPH